MIEQGGFARRLQADDGNDEQFPALLTQKINIEEGSYASSRRKAIKPRNDHDLLVQTTVPVEKTLKFTVEDAAFGQQLQLLVFTKYDMGGFTGHSFSKTLRSECLSVK